MINQPEAFSEFVSAHHAKPSLARRADVAGKKKNKKPTNQWLVQEVDQNKKKKSDGTKSALGTSGNPDLSVHIL